MAIKLAINGFGRIGRLAFREIIYRNSEIEVVGINDLTNANTLAHLLKYDSVHGRFKGEVAVEDNFLIVNGKRIAIYAEPNLEAIP